jgi:hypothetical protein
MAKLQRKLQALICQAFVHGEANVALALHSPSENRTAGTSPSAHAGIGITYPTENSSSSESLSNSSERFKQQ